MKTENIKLTTNVLMLASCAILGYSFFKYFQPKYDPSQNIETQEVYKQLSNEDQTRLKTLIPVLNQGLVREKSFWEKSSYYQMRRTSQKEFEEVAKRSIIVDKQCEQSGKHVNKIERPYLDWNPDEISCG